MLSAIASVVAGKTPAEISPIMDRIVDPVGIFYRFGLAHSLLRLALLTNHICGVCPEAHHMAAAKAAEAVYHVEPPRTGKVATRAAL